MEIEIGKEYTFDYPAAFVTLPYYSEHRGQKVKVIRDAIKNSDTPDNSGEYDYEFELMYFIEAEDGWTGMAWESELV